MNAKNGRGAGMPRWGSLVSSAMIAIGCGCGGSPKSVASPPSATTSSAGAVDPADAGSAATTPGSPSAANSTTATAGGASGAPPSPPAAPASPPPPAHPFANNAAEASSLIDDAITSRANELGQCVEDARTRRKSAHARLVIEVGIDEEGHMLGVKLPKGEKADKTFSDCVLTALRGAPFPKSHAGVITVRKTFEDKAVYR
jgi:hypothetical protein